MATTKTKAKTQQTSPQSHDETQTMRGVLITTQHRGVFFGYIGQGVKPVDGELHVTACRNCLYWPNKVKGFIGLAKVGPLDGSRIGPAADCTLYGVTCIAECTPEAVAQWEKSPWS